MLVLQVTGAGVRRPGYVAKIAYLPVVHASDPVLPVRGGGRSPHCRHCHSTHRSHSAASLSGTAEDLAPQHCLWRSKRLESNTLRN